jgi:hypothetical protein
MLRPRATSRLPPVHLDLLLAAIAVMVFNVSVLHPEFVDAFGHFDIVAAVLSDLGYLALLPPFESIETIGGLPCAKSGGSDGIELNAVAEGFFEINEKVKAVKLVAEVKEAMTHEHFVVEADVVKSDHEVRSAELVDQRLGFLF